MHSYDAVLHFASTAAPLPLDAHRVRTAFGHGRLIDDANRFGIRVLVGYDLLAALAQTFFVPLDGFEKSL